MMPSLRCVSPKAFILFICLSPVVARTEGNSVPRGPRFVEEPQDVIFDASSSTIIRQVSLRCRAEGYPYPSYQWYKQEYVEGRSVAKRVNPLSDPRITLAAGTLIVYQPEATVDRGTYYCEASNRYGVIVSRPARIDFGYLGQFTSKPSRVVGREFWGKAIYCDPPPHHPGVHYHWVWDAMPNLVEETARVFSSRDGHLYFSSLDEIDVGQYRCAVQSSISDSGRTGPTVTLEVHRHASGQQLKFPSAFPKAFPEAPVAGEDVVLECMAFGYPVPTYSWRRKGDSTELPRNVSIVNYNRVLILPIVVIEDSGEYICIASNEKGLITASIAVTVRARPTFKIAAHYVVIEEDANVEWECEASGVPAVHYEWLKNGESLLDILNQEDSPRYFIRKNVLRIQLVNPNRDRGVYQCKASNILGTSYSSWELWIAGLPPSFSQYSIEEEILAIEGGNATLSCRPNGIPTPKIKWQFGGSSLQFPENQMDQSDGHQLVIANVTWGNQGEYSCVATNRYGWAKSRSYLRVFASPVFVRRPPLLMTTRFGEPIRLECEVRLDPVLDVVYVWHRNGLRTDSFTHGRYYSGTEPGSLLLRDTTTDDTGDFECWAITPLCRISAKVHLIVEGPPDPPGGLQIFSPNDTWIQLEWTNGAINGKPIVSYTLEGCTEWNKTWVTILPAFEPDHITKMGRRRILINSRLLPAWAQLQFRVIASNEFGAGLPSAPSPIFNTAPDNPRMYPENIGGGGGNVGDLTITWTPLQPQDWSGPEIFYRVFYRAVSQPSSVYHQVDLNSDGNAGLRVVRVGVQNFYRAYTVKVQAINGIGEGPLSPEVVVFSAEDRPRIVPSKVSAVPYNATAVNVSWHLVDQLTHENMRGKLINFRVKYWQAAKEDPNYEATYHRSRHLYNWLLVVGLRPGTKYAVASMACNSAGCGSESDSYIVRTLKSAPLTAPTSVQIEAVQLDSIRVTWRASPASHEEEPYMGFKVRYWESYQGFTSYQDTVVDAADGELVTVVSELKPGVPYKLRVLAYSRGGDGRMSSPTVEFQLGDEETLQGHTTVARKNDFVVALLFLPVILWCS